MNIAVNPWSFTAADVPASSIGAASPGGMVQAGKNLGELALGTVLYTSTLAHGLVANQFVTYIGDTNGRFQGLYRVVAVPTVTTALLQNISSQTSGQPFNTIIAASGGGTMLVNQVQQNVRIEDISVLAGPGGAPAATILSILDRNGFILWTFLGTAIDPGFASQNRGKLMWVDGITLQSIPANCTVLMTIN
jgi:hypothetical protein